MLPPNATARLLHVVPPMPGIHVLQSASLVLLRKVLGDTLLDIGLGLLHRVQPPVADHAHPILTMLLNKSSTPLLLPRTLRSRLLLCDSRRLLLQLPHNLIRSTIIPNTSHLLIILETRKLLIFAIILEVVERVVQWVRAGLVLMDNLDDLSRLITLDACDGRLDSCW